jgi:transposase InsO family protein
MRLGQAWELVELNSAVARQIQGVPPAICAASVHAKAAFEASGRSYGSRRLSQALKARELAIGRHRSRTLMRINALRSQWRRKFVHTTDSRHGLPVAPNVLDRQFKPATRDQPWYIRTRSGWLYLATWARHGNGVLRSCEAPVVGSASELGACALHD